MRYDKQNNKLYRLTGQVDQLREDKRRLENERDRLKNILDGILHETRRLNREIGDFCDDLSLSVRTNNVTGINDNAESVMFTSGLISSRLTFAEFELNPQSLSLQGKARIGIYRKFDKSKRLLQKAARRKECKIAFEGNSYAEIDTIPAFELVPFVLLDNAIKYSPKGQLITVTFADRPNFRCLTKVTVTSIGPLVPPDDIFRLKERGFRGGQAGRSNIPGEGLGLYLADILCRMANAELVINSSTYTEYSLDGIPYSKFSVDMDFCNM